MVITGRFFSFVGLLLEQVGIFPLLGYSYIGTGRFISFVGLWLEQVGIRALASRKLTLNSILAGAPFKYSVQK